MAVMAFALLRLSAADPLADGFRQPPESARPLVFWQWMNGCVTKEGITSDLESFQRAGLGGVQQFLVGGSEAIVTDPTVQVLNPKWRELMSFAIAECARLGLTFGTHNCPGWSASGSPGVLPADAMKKLTWSVTTVAGEAEVELAALPQPAADRRYYREVIVLALPADGPARPEDVQVLATTRWRAPAGRWKIYRFGETLTGAVNGTAPLSGQGLEVDKLNRAALERFWATYPGQLIELAGRHAGSTFTRLELDSYEAGVQDWTTDALAQFSAECGYDARAWLPVLAGEMIGGPDASQRFREDWHLMVSHSLAENYFGHLGELIRRKPGMKFLLEPYATGQGELFTTSEVGAKGDHLMGEFWVGPTTWGWDSLKPVASAVHTLGQRVVLAEAFTGQPMYGWRFAPYDLKAPGDHAFAMGVNRMVLHAAAHQPWPHLKPGMTMGWWGTQFGPGQTWWEHGGPEWLAYLSRCQFLLQQGTFIGDLAFFSPGRTTPTLPAGYDGDTVGENVLLERLAVRDGRLVLPEGGSYRALILPALPAMKLEVLEKLRGLVEQGAIVAGPRPGRLLGQRGGRAAETRFGQLVAELWEQGRVRADTSPAPLLAALAVEPDLQVESGPQVRWIHRRTEHEDIYFIANPGAAAPVALSFRATAPEVEIWHPDTGTVEPARPAAATNDRTRLVLDLESTGSCFVVFRSAPTPGRTEPLATVAARTEMTGAWQLSFPPGLGAPAQTNIDRLVSWTDHPDDGIRHFSGTATYRRTFAVPADFLVSGRHVFLDLGQVRHVAEVRVNGTAFPALWKPPYRLDLTPAMRVGANDLEIQLTNLWPNRLIGDAREPEDAEWGPEQHFKYVESNPVVGRPLLKIPDWVERSLGRPSAHRVTFSSYEFFKADAPLLESGLLGPVYLESVGVLSLPATSRVQAADPGGSTAWFSLQGTLVPGGNAPDEHGLVRKFDAAVLGVTRTTRHDSLGTVLLLPGGGYNILDVLNEGARTAAALNNFGYDVAMLEYHVGAGTKSRAAALEDALAAWRLLKEKPAVLGIRGRRGIVMGYSAGGHLATRLVQELPEKERPDDVVLVYPAYLDEMAAEARTTAVQPPVHPRSRLIAIMAADDRATWLKGCRDYVDAWRKAGGEGIMFQFKDGGHGFGLKPDLTGDIAHWPDILNYFLENGLKPGVGPFNTVLPWFLPNRDERLARFKADQNADQGAVVFLGDSITAKWPLAQAFPEYKIANRGISGDTTRGMLCRFEVNVLALHPQALVFLGGINDLFAGGTPETVSTNVRSILELARKADDLPIFVGEILPCKGRPRELMMATNAALAKVVGDFANVHLVKTYAPLLKPDGIQDETLFLDGTHPNEAGYAVLQKTLSLELAKYVRRD